MLLAETISIDSAAIVAGATAIGGALAAGLRWAQAAKKTADDDRQKRAEEHDLNLVGRYEGLMGRVEDLSKNHADSEAETRGLIREIERRADRTTQQLLSLLKEQVGAAERLTITIQEMRITLNDMHEANTTLKERVDRLERGASGA